MTIRRLPPLSPHEERDSGAEDHPMRRVTRAVAFGGEEWTPHVAADVGGFFDRLAPEWHTRGHPERLVPVADALERGGPFANGVAVELGSGTGLATATIAARLPRLVAIDLSMEMLRLAPNAVPRVRADGARLPFPNRSVAALVLVNMLLFPREVDRVLAPAGALVWVSSSGAGTPIYLAPEEVDAALPGHWDLVASGAGRGTWCVARRAV